MAKLTFEEYNSPRQESHIRGVMQMTYCPVCRSAVFHQECPVKAMRSEIMMRRDFVFGRMALAATRAETKDLTDFMHGFPTPVLRCATCGVLIRQEQDLQEAHSYQEDPNDLDLMEHLLPRYRAAFRNKEMAYRDLLKPNAIVLELGSHLGAFLQVAEEWNWDATGLDVGRDTASFARRHGFEVIEDVLEGAGLHSEDADAVFIWNCFEQLPVPDTTLTAARQVLKPHGLLVIRVPNALFYRTFRQDLDFEKPDGRASQALAYNNLLGFPYLYGYTAEALNGLLGRFGFRYVRGFNSELVTTPFPDETTRVVNEQMAISRTVTRWSAMSSERSGTLTGPWIELVYRKLSDRDVERSRPKLARERLPRKRIDLRFLERAA